MPTAELRSLENLNALVAQIPLIDADGQKTAFEKLQNPYDKWAVSAARVFIESILAAGREPYEEFPGYGTEDFLNSKLAKVFAKNGYHYGFCFGELETDQEVIYFQDQLLDGYYVLDVLAVKAGKIWQGRERQAEVLSNIWQLIGAGELSVDTLDFAKDRAVALTEGLISQKLELKNVGNIVQTRVGCGYFGLLVPTLQGRSTLI